MPVSAEHKKLIQNIKSVLSPDLLKPEFRKDYDENNPTYGQCYAATEALYHMLGGKEKSGFRPFRGKDDKDVTHWWLQNDKGEILDPTKDQYLSVGRKPPYENGKGGGFLTKDPSKRASEIIRRVEKKRALTDKDNLLQKTDVIVEKLKSVKSR